MKIGVYGAATDKIPNEIREKAKEIGRQIARKGCILVTGACHGLPYDAVLGAYELGGQCIGFSPAVDLDMHIKRYRFPVEGFSEFVFVPKDYIHADNPLICKKYRNVSSVGEVDSAIIIDGRIGTMNEFTIAYDLGKNIGILEGSGGITSEAIKTLLRGIDKDTESEIIYDPDPISLVNKLIEL